MILINVPQEDKDQTKGDTKPQAKLESATPKETVKPAKALTADKGRKQETLLDLFKNDFNNLFRPNADYNILTAKTKDKDDELVTIKGQAYEDFASQTVFVGFYIPNTPHTYAICVHLADNYNIALELTTKPAKIEFSMPGLQPVSSSELKFSGRVFIYHESPLFEEQKRELFSLYKAKGLSLQFRDWKYVVEKNNESLTSGSTGSPKRPGSR